jgi:serpin B
VRWPFGSKRKTSLAPIEESPAAARRFSFKVLRELAKTEGPSNLFFSPFSIMMCLLMLHEGATGETRDAIAKALEITDEAGEDGQRSLRSMQSLSQLDVPGARLALANSLWCDTQAHVRADFVAHVRDLLGAEAFELPLQKPSSIARINAWVAKKTEGKIKSILSELQPLAALVAINAIYFKGLWASPFSKMFTRPESFYPEHGPALRLPFMRHSGTYGYLEESKFQAVRIPYREKRISAYVFLPRKKVNFASFHENLTSSVWDGWMRSFRPMKGMVTMPRFRAEYQCVLNPVLRTLGMSEAMDPILARFDRIAASPPALWIDQVLHRALVEVNEEGTEAVAVTRVTFLAKSARQEREPTFEMIVDHPFLFVIRDDQSGTILFIGCIHAPEPLA